MPVPAGAILKVIEGVDVYAPEPLGRMDLLVAGGRIAALGPGPFRVQGADLEVTSGAGKILVPGFIDSHVHLLGGGGEGGYASRTPELVLSDLAVAGVTTVVGCLGTDGTTRSMASLVAKARGLDEEGVSSYVYTGSYQVPVRTLTGSVQDDLILIDKVLGVGEIAISDHRSSQPTFEEVARAVADARLGGMLSGKAGVVNVHMGDGPRMLELLERIVRETEIPARHLVPTHMNRNARLLAAGIAYAREDGGRGRYLDLTTSGLSDDVQRSAGAVLGQLLQAGVAIASISFSSDGQGSLPVFGPGGEYLGLGVGKVDSLFAEVRRAVRDYQVPLEVALQAVTTTPAAYLKLEAKGRLRPGADADLVLLDRNLEVDAVLAKGEWLVREHRLQRQGTFERDAAESLSRKRAAYGA